MHKTQVTYRQYPLEFKQGTVTLLLEQDDSVPATAKPLGSTITLLRR